jgi:ACDE family multidrug resistance protein
LGVAAGPPLIGMLMDIKDEWVFVTLSVLSGISLALVFFLVKPEGNLSSESN